MLSVKKKFSHLGFSIIFYVVISNLVSVVAMVLYVFAIVIFAVSAMESYSTGEVIQAALRVMSTIDNQSALETIVTMLPAYLIATPLTLMILNSGKYKDVPLKTFSFLTDYEKNEKRNLTIPEFFGFFVVAVFFGVAGSLVAAGLSYVFYLITGIEMNNTLTSYLQNMSLPMIFFIAVILAPIFEELLYRYGVVGYSMRYGEWNAIILSAVIFGLVHTNIFQFFYAFLLGGLFAYIYIYTRQIKYTIAMHILFNFLGAFVPLSISPDGEMTTPYMIFAVIQYLVAITGLIVLIVNVSKGKLLKTKENAPIPGGASRDSFLNPGMITLIIVCIILTFVMQGIS